jgi:RND superfamily putative drug exporter
MSVAPSQLREPDARHGFVIRWGVPLLLVVAWLAVSGLGGPYFGRLADVQSQTLADFLPATAESTRVAELTEAAAPDAGLPAIVVFSASDGVPAESTPAIRDILERISAVEGVVGASPPLPSDTLNADGSPAAFEAFVSIDGDPGEVVAAIRAITAEAPPGLSVHVTGPAGFAADLTEAFGGIDGILLLVAVAAVLVILLIVYRSPLLPLIVLFSSVSALAASVVVVYEMAAADWIRINGQAQGILFILVIGASTDYALLLVARYREHLRDEASHITALWRAWRGVLEPVAASAGTVVAGLLCLLLSDLNSNKALGPVAAVGIVCALLAAMTLLPALLALIGRAVFFPATPRVRDASEREAGEGGFWARVAGLVQRRPRLVWAVSAGALVVLAVAAPRLDATGVEQSEFLLGESEAVAGQEVLAAYFPAGSGSPLRVVAPADAAEAAVDQLADDEAVASAAAAMSFEANGVALTLIEATLVYAADSDEALAAVERLRDELRQVDPDILIGGTSASNLDTRDAASRDLWTIVPIVLVVIFAILILLLRSVLAPALLILTTVVSYLAALGISALVFEFIFGFPGADPAVPLFAFVFLVALGIDYNIFLTTRVREEAKQLGTRPGILRGLQTTGGVITSAGIVLAVTFAALAVIPILFLVQIAFIVALGVLIDALVVRSFLVPGLFYEIGPPIWWPSRRASEPAA